jgi:hypothetical protein
LRMLRLALVILALLTAAGCTGTEEKASPTVEPSLSPLTSPLSPLASPPPATEAAGAATPRVPAPRGDTGTVVGILHVTGTSEPYRHQYIYLARLRELESKQGGDPAYFAELDVTTAPFAQTDAQGRFLIEDVEPGTYTLVVRLPTLQEVLLHNADTSNNVAMEVKAGEISDIGTITILPPE